MSNSYDIIRGFAEGGGLEDYLPVAGWFHFPLDDPDPDRFIATTNRHVAADEWDFVKIMTNGNYIPIAYGADYEWSTNPQKWDGVFKSHPIASALDAENLPALAPDEGILAREVDIARRLAAEHQGARPVIATLFDPLSWVQELSTPLEPAFTLRLLREEPESLEHALAALQETNERFLDALIDAGIDGVFFSTKFSTSQLLTPEEHARFVEPYLARTNDRLLGRTWFNLLHIHGDAGLLVDQLLTYRAFNAWNWESAAAVDGATSIAEVRAKDPAKIIVAGIEQHGDFEGTREQVKTRLAARLQTALEENAGGPIVFAPGCSLPLTVDNALFSLLAEVAREAGLRP